MKQAQKVTTRFPIESDLGTDKIKRLSDLINEVYDDAESGMWKRKGTRTNPAEVERLLRAQALILAEIDGVLVGSVNVNLMSDGVGEFGMLVADNKYRGKGIGSALVKHLRGGPASTHVTKCALGYSLRAIGHTRARNF
jgi:GNAT superfamily N-acetyltransferase